MEDIKEPMPYDSELQRLSTIWPPFSSSSASLANALTAITEAGQALVLHFGRTTNRR